MIGRGRKMNRSAGDSHWPPWPVTADWVTNGRTAASGAGVCVWNDCVVRKTNSRCVSVCVCVCAPGQGLATPHPEPHTENVRHCFHPSPLLIYWRNVKSSRASLTGHPSTFADSGICSESSWRQRFILKLLAADVTCRGERDRRKLNRQQPFPPF